MKKDKNWNFIVIDDDEINNVLCRIIITSAMSEAKITTFNKPKDALEFIRKEYSMQKKKTPTVVFLDINMPVWSGWDFLDHFSKESKKIKEQMKIYLLSSSVDPKDLARANAHENVVNLIPKPLTREIVLKTIESEVYDN